VTRKPAPPGKVRIIAGSMRNSRLPVLDAPGLRPTPDRVRETLFNWLAPVVAGSRCLDLYAGTGALGFEAASRGARAVVMVERDRRLADSLRDEAARLEIAAVQIVCGDALRYLDGQAEPFDIAFLDPPFDAAAWTPAAAALESGGWLAPDALIYVESPRNAPPAMPDNWSPWREGHAGEVRYALYRRPL
jgi:16S rRNA (guanine966-N2)-methyltransferase